MPSLPEVGISGPPAGAGVTVSTSTSSTSDPSKATAANTESISSIDQTALKRISASIKKMQHGTPLLKKIKTEGADEDVDLEICLFKLSSDCSMVHWTSKKDPTGERGVIDLDDVVKIDGALGSKLPSEF